MCNENLLISKIYIFLKRLSLHAKFHCTYKHLCNNLEHLKTTMSAEKQLFMKLCLSLTGQI